jgi:ABC-type polysaccharide/polyol phosphate export permease
MSRNFFHLFRQLVLKDFRTRYRNMSLGVFWSLLNPLVTMALLTFVFTQIFSPPDVSNFPVFVLCGIVPFNFFSLAWFSSTVSLQDNAQLIKKVDIPRVLIPLSTVLGNAVHLAIQFGLLLVFVLAFGFRPNIYWLLLPVIWGLTILFVCGISMITSALHVFLRDMRYVVESANTVLFWLVPIFYPFTAIPEGFREIYSLNPVAALVLSMRQILMIGVMPATSLLVKLSLVSLLAFAAGLLFFRRVEDRFYEYL